MGCGSSASLAEKVGYLKNSPFCLHMSNEQLQTFAGYFQVKRFARSTVIYNEEDKGEEFFILGTPYIRRNMDMTHRWRDGYIVEGEVDMTALDADKQDQFLCSKKPGDFFGERAILVEECQREATVTATEACVTLIIHQKNYAKFVREAGDTMRETLSQVMGERMLNCIKKIEFLSTLNDWQLQFLCNLFHFKIVEKDETVFEEGDLGRQMYVVSQGSVKVVARDKDGKEVFFKTLNSGDYFGEIALMVDMPRTATVTACERCLLLVLGLDDFRNFLHVVPELKEHFEKVVKDRTAEQFKKFKVPFFENFPADRLRELAGLCVLQKYDPGAVIFREGDPGDAFYLVVWGELNVLKETRVVGTIKAGRYFGEVALVTDQNRTATIAAITRCVLLALTKENFQLFFQTTPDAYAEFAIKLGRHDCQLQSVLMHSKGRIYFTEHLAGEYSLENINFWMATTIFEEMKEDDPEALQKRAAEIIDTFVDAKADQQVNIPATRRNEVIDKFKNGHITPTLFQDARKEILKLMSSDSFKRFKSGDKFEKLLTEVGSFADPPQGSTRASMAFTTSPFASAPRSLLGNLGGSAPPTPTPPSARTSMVTGAVGVSTAPPTSLWPTGAPPVATSTHPEAPSTPVIGTGAGATRGSIAYVQMIELKEVKLEDAVPATPPATD